LTAARAQIKSQYQRQLPIYKRLEEEASFALKSVIERRGIKVHSVASRIKELDSFVGKLEKKRFQNPFQEMSDVVGLRVVCLFIGDIQNVRDAIHDSFNVVSEDDKIEGYDPSSFGYMSLHLVVTMKKGYSGPRYAEIASLPFEIQVRTIAMEAWATVSHYLDYKTEKDVPKKLRKDFYALAGLFYVADKHFETFYKAGEVARKQLRQAFSSSNPPLDVKISQDAMDAYLHAKLPKWKHYHTDTSLVSKLASVGLTKMSQIDDAFRRGWNAFLQYENNYNKEGKYYDTTVAIVIVSLVYPKFQKAWGTTGAFKKYRKLVIQ